MIAVLDSEALAQEFYREATDIAQCAIRRLEHEDPESVIRTSIIDAMSVILGVLDGSTSLPSGFVDVDLTNANGQHLHDLQTYFLEAWQNSGS